MKITRKWAMPNSDTFSVKPIKDFITPYFKKGVKAVDPFVKNSPFKKLCFSNDINKAVVADRNLDALDFLKSIKSASVDLLLFDPPYSPRQVSECYKTAEKSVNMQTTQASFWSGLKREISRVVKNGGTVITCGWNSGGVGKKYGFTIQEILLVAHGGWHNDTIVTVETKGIIK